MSLSECVLPGGLIDARGQVHKHTKFRSLSGQEEEMLLNLQGSTIPEKVSKLISQCVQSIGTISPVSEEHARQCLAADRQYLMLKLRQLSFGDKVAFSVACPWQGCAQRVDVDFSISQLDVGDAGLERVVHTWVVPDELVSKAKSICFRLPNGEDQETLIALVEQDEIRALDELLWRCIQRIDNVEQPSRADVQALPVVVRKAFEQHMQNLAPDMEIVMKARCPECAREFDLPFDIQEFFLRELSTNQDVLRREVHYLAFHYHWSEQDILNMSRDKRRQYIQTLAEEIERMNESVSRYAAA